MCIDRGEIQKIVEQSCAFVDSKKKGRLISETERERDTCDCFSVMKLNDDFQQIKLRKEIL